MHRCGHPARTWDRRTSCSSVGSGATEAAALRPARL